MNTGANIQPKLHNSNIEYFSVWLPVLQVNFNPFTMYQFCYSSSNTDKL